MDIDAVEKKLYFQDGDSISTFNLEDTEDICVEVFAKDTTASDMAFDWIGRRIYRSPDATAYFRFLYF